MQRVVSSVQDVNALIGDITHAAISQSDGLADVNARVGQLDEMTQHNAALVEESAAAAASLRQQAERLTVAVGRFKLSGEVQRVGC
jgi:methyl-accepting chemotaxis protein